MTGSRSIEGALHLAIRRQGQGVNSPDQGFSLPPWSELTTKAVMRGSKDRPSTVGGRVLAATALCLLLAGCSGARAFGSGALTPLDDLNLRREVIPPVLLAAASDPYGSRNMERCQSIAREVYDLDDALGPDMDEPAEPDAAWGDRVAGAAGELSVGLLIDTAVDFLPVRDWVRQLSGAERHDQAVKGAIQNGRVRRAFLKGSGMRMNCLPPAAPSWFEPREAEPHYQSMRREPPPPRRVRPPWARY